MNQKNYEQQKNYIKNDNSIGITEKMKLEKELYDKRYESYRKNIEK